MIYTVSGDRIGGMRRHGLIPHMGISSWRSLRYSEARHMPSCREAAEMFQRLPFRLQ
jgi:hypothetical protein